MNSSLRQFLETMYSIVQSIGSNFAGTEEMDKACKYELATFMMYLSASDGTIDRTESKVIGYYTGLDMTPQQIGDHIRENNIYSTDFENRVPETVKLLVKADNLVYQNNGNVEQFGSELMLKAYRGLADELAGADGEVSLNEKADIDIYIGNIERYIDDNLLSRKGGATGFTKSKGSGGIQAPTKSGVAAPQKG